MVMFGIVNSTILTNFLFPGGGGEKESYEKESSEDANIQAPWGMLNPCGALLGDSGFFFAEYNIIS